MSRSPLRTLLFLAIVFSVLGVLFSQIQIAIDWHDLKKMPQVNELRLARYYWSTGQIDKAIKEYEQTISSTNQPTSSLARNELNLLITDEENSQKRFLSYLSYVAWILPPSLFLLGVIFFTLWLLVFVVRLIIKKPLFAILPIKDISGLNIGEAIPKMATERLKEVLWRMDTLESTSSLISESLELPIMGMISEGKSIDTLALIETAFMFSGITTSLPLSKLINSLQLWLEQPKYIVEGSISKWGNKIYVHISLLGQNNTVEDTWNTEVNFDQKADGIAQIIDTIIYPLTIRFNKKISTKKWEALKALHDGLQEFQLYRNNGYSFIHLNRAKEQMEKALLIDPEYIIAKNNLGLLLLRSGEYENARALFREISNSDIKEYRGLGLYYYGVALFHLGQDWAYKRALDSFNTVIADPNSVDKKFINLVRSALAITYARLATRENRNSEKYINLAVKESEYVLASDQAAYESQANALAAKGLVFQIKKEYPSAISTFIYGTQKFPENLACFIGLGDVLLQTGQMDDAIEVFRKAKSLTPSSGYCNYRIGNIYQRQGDYESALEAYKSAQGFALAHVESGKIYLSNLEYEKALDEFKLASQINKRLSDAWVNIAWVICEMKDDGRELYKEAEDAARRSLQLEYNKDKLWHRHAVLARVLLLEGKNEISIKESLKAIKANSEKAQAYYYLAEAEYQSGRHEKSRKALKKVLDLEGEDWHIKAEDLLNQLAETKVLKKENL